jgi:hypothetical protein
MDKNVKCYCISLNENQEQRLWLLKHFEELGLNVEFYIVERSVLGGRHGCFESHIAALKMGLASRRPYIWVMEDDVYFDCTQSKLEDLYQEVLKLTGNWCFCFGYLTTCPATIVNDQIRSLYNCVCMHAYLVPRRTAKRLVTMEWKNQPIDHQWKEKIEKFYVPYPMVAYQHDHPSTVSNDWVGMLGFKKCAKLSEFWSNLVTF